MKTKEGERIWRGDNTVDFSRKKRTMRNNGRVSSRYNRFDPEDLTVDGDDWECNPSVNKKAWAASNEFDDALNYKAYLLNKGMGDAVEEPRSLNNFFDEPEITE